jgi:hypothetical protein
MNGMGAGYGLPPTPAPTQTEDPMSEIISMLKGGQVGAERFVELLTMLTSNTLGPQDGPAAQPAPADPSSITSLLGG